MTLTQDNPVERLRALDFRPNFDSDYQGLGINESHTEELIVLVKEQTCLVDDGEGEGYKDADDLSIADMRWFASIHAWMALGQLGAPAGASALIDQIPIGRTHDILWVCECIPHLLSRLGPTVYPLLREAFEQNPVQAENADENDQHPDHQVLIESMYLLAKAHPECKAAVVEFLVQQLSQCLDDDCPEWRLESYEYNTTLISGLIELKASEHIELIRAVYKTNTIDRSWFGEIEYIEFELGLGPDPSPKHNSKNIFTKNIGSAHAGPSHDMSRAKKDAAKKKKRKKKKTAKKSKKKGRR